MMMSVLEVPSAGGTSQGTASVKEVGVAPLLCDDARNLLWDLVARSTSAGVSGSAAPGDAAPAPGSSGGTGLGVSGLYLPSSFSSSHPPINWSQVGDETESACSLVATAERLLHEMLASVHQNILHLIRVSLTREKILPTFL
jgi:hypothetical protein